MGNFEPSLDRVGVLSEQLVFNQLLHSAWANDEDIEISTFRQNKGVEIDFNVKHKNILSAVEVKDSDRIQTDDLDGLLYLKKNQPKSKIFIFSIWGPKKQKWGMFGVCLCKKVCLKWDFDILR